MVPGGSWEDAGDIALLDPPLQKRIKTPATVTETIEALLDEPSEASIATGPDIHPSYDPTDLQGTCDRLFAEHYDYMFQVAFKITGDPDMAQDAVTDYWRGLSRKFQNDPEFVPRRKFKNFLYTGILQSTRTIMSRKNEKHRNYPEPSMDPEIIDQMGRNASNGLRSEIMEVLERMPDILAVPLRLKYFDGLNASEIGRRLRISERYMRQLVRKGETLFADLYQKGDPEMHYRKIA